MWWHRTQTTSEKSMRYQSKRIDSRSTVELVNELSIFNTLHSK